MINFVKTKVFYNSVLDQVCFWWTLHHHWCLFLIKCVNRNPLLTRSEEKLKLRRVFGGCCSMFWKHRRKDEQRMWTWQPPPTPSCGAKLWEQPCFHVHLWSAEQVCTLLQALITAELIRCFQALKGAESTSDLLFLLCILSLRSHTWCSQAPEAAAGQTSDLPLPHCPAAGFSTSSGVFLMHVLLMSFSCTHMCTLPTAKYKNLLLEGVRGAKAAGPSILSILLVVH